MTIIASRSKTEGLAKRLSQLLADGGDLRLHVGDVQVQEFGQTPARDLVQEEGLDRQGLEALWQGAVGRTLLAMGRAQAGIPVQAVGILDWGAHAFAGALLMSRPALRKARLADTIALADRFQVSEAFAKSHLKRIRRAL